MKQSEKLDLILRGLYQHQEQKYWTVGEILRPLGISTSNEEDWRLAHRLYHDGFIDEPMMSNGEPLCHINTYGIEYCEEDSYTYKGESLITNNYNISITDSTNATIVTNSQNVSIAITNYSEVKNKIAEIRDAVKSDTAIQENKQMEILECLDEMDKSVEAGSIPKYSFRGLLGLAADVATVTPLLIALAKLLGVHLP